MPIWRIALYLVGFMTLPWLLLVAFTIVSMLVACAVVSGGHSAQSRVLALLPVRRR